MTLDDDIYSTKPLSLVSKAIESVTGIGIIYEKETQKNLYVFLL